MEMNGTTIIGRPVKEVSDFVFDVSNDVQWRKGVVESGYVKGDSVAEGNIGYTRVGNMEVRWKVLSAVPMERVDWELLNGPIKGKGGYRMEAEEGGCKFTLVADVQPSGLYTLLGPLFRRIGRRRNQADVEKLKAILESKSSDI